MNTPTQNNVENPVETPEVQEEITQETEFDYKAEYERLTTKESDPKEHNRQGFQMRKQKVKQIEPEDVEIEEELLEDVVAQRVAEEMKDVKRLLIDRTLEETLSKFTNDVDKRNVILYHYENSILRTGNSSSAIAEDLRKAEALADLSKSRQRSTEVDFAQQNQAMSQNAVDMASMKTGAGTNPQVNLRHEARKAGVSDSEWTRMQDHGFTDEQVKELINKRKQN